MPKLYELAENYKNVWQLIEDESMDLAVIEDTLQSIEGAIEEKAVNIAKFMQSMKADAEAIKAEEKRLADRRKAIENRQKQLKEYLQQQMELAGLDKIKTATHTIAIQNNPPAVVITDETAIPPSYLTIIPEQYVPDKKRIAEAFKNGECVPGCELRQGKSLRIR